jgi:hypothetical protein
MGVKTTVQFLTIPLSPDNYPDYCFSLIPSAPAWDNGSGARCFEIIARFEPRQSPPGGNDPSPHGSFDVKGPGHVEGGSKRI